MFLLRVYFPDKFMLYLKLICRFPEVIMPNRIADTPAFFVVFLSLASKGSYLCAKNEEIFAHKRSLVQKRALKLVSCSGRTNHLNRPLNDTCKVCRYHQNFNAHILKCFENSLFYLFYLSFVIVTFVDSKNRQKMEELIFVKELFPWNQIDSNH